MGSRFRGESAVADEIIDKTHTPQQKDPHGDKHAFWEESLRHACHDWTTVSVSLYLFLDSEMNLYISRMFFMEMIFFFFLLFMPKTPENQN